MITMPNTYLQYEYEMWKQQDKLQHLFIKFQFYIIYIKAINLVYISNAIIL